jgi:DNA repair protein RecN (Recombination protein N)
VHKEVIKNQTYIRCKPLSLDEVRKELSRMAGGGNQGEALANQLLKERQ